MDAEAGGHLAGADALPPGASATQRNRLFSQAMSVMEVVQQQRDRDLLQLGELEDAKRVADTTEATPSLATQKTVEAKAPAVLADRQQQQMPSSGRASDENREQGASRNNAPTPDMGWGGVEGEEGGEGWRRRLGVGSKLDVEDTVRRWCEASVIAVDEAGASVLVTYTYWAQQYDEWVKISSRRLAPPKTKTYQDGGRLCVGHRIEAQDDNGEWMQAFVADVHPDGRALVKFVRRDNRPDILVRPGGGRVRQFGPYRAMPRGKTSARQASLAPGQQHVRQIAELSSRYEQYRTALRSQGLRVVPVEGDGNCLFRSVSHQIYGDDSHHRLVRARCMDYMESEAHFFEPYVEGDMAAFLSYLGIKRRNAVWGDDPEVQALSEIYDRPAEIWAYDPQLGAKRLRTFHEAAGIATGGSLESRRPPMRLSYYGGGHYDSVSPIDEPYSGNPPVGEEGVGRGRRGGGSFGPASGVAEPVREPGQLEDEALERSRRRAAEASSGRWGLEEMKLRRDDEGPSGQTPVDEALAFSRNEFEAQFTDLDSALVASVDHMEQSNLISLEAASRDSELVVLQEEMIRSAQAQSEEEQMRNALEASCKTAAAAEDEAELVRRALAESMASVAVGGPAMGAGGAQAGDSAAAAAAAAAAAGVASPAADQIRETLSLGGSVDGLGGAMEGLGGVLDGDEDEELKRALLLSRMGVDGGESPGEAALGLGQGSVLDDLQEDPELKFAINASLFE
eukprot:jgi/Undpi1/5951/HiC_scaffold_2.g01225.m1